MKTQIHLLVVCLTLMIVSASAQKKTQNNNTQSAAQATKIKQTFAGKESGNITKEELLSDSLVRLSYEDSLGTHNPQVISFTISIIQKGTSPIFNLPSDGNRMPEKFKDLILTLHAGDRIFIEKIRMENELYVMSKENKNGVSIPHRIRVGLEPMAFIIADK